MGPVVGNQAGATVAHLEREDGPSARRVPCRVRERLLSDPVQRDPDAACNGGMVSTHAQLDRETSGPGVLDERRDLARRRDRWRRAGLVIAAQERDGPAQLSHAPPAHLLGRAQGLLHRRGVAVQHVAGAGDLEHHGGQPVAHEVVNVAGDPAPLHQQRLLRELAPGRLELGDQLGLAAGRRPKTHGKAMPRIQIPVEISDGSWITAAITGASSASTPSSADSLVDEADRPITNARRDTSKSSGSSCPERCATTAGTITASDSASSGTPVTRAHTRNGAAASAQSTRSAADAGSATAAMMAAPTEKTGIKTRTSSVCDHSGNDPPDTPRRYCCNGSRDTPRGRRRELRPRGDTPPI